MLARTRVRASVIVLLTAALVLSVAGCGSDDEPSSTAKNSESASTDQAPSSVASDLDLVETPLAPKPLAEKETITVVVPTVGEWAAPFWVALQAGEFTKENLEVKTTTADISTALTLLARGDAQFQLAGVNPGFLNAVDQGVPVAYVASIHLGDPTTQGFWVRNEYLKADGSLDADKARGMKIGVIGGLNSNALLPPYEYFKDSGLAYGSDYEIVNLANQQELVVAFENGSIGGAYFVNPFQRSAEDSKTGTLVAGKGWVASVYVANKSFLADKPEASQAFFRAISRATSNNLVGDYKTKPESLALLAAALQQPEDQLRSTLPLEFDPTLPMELNLDRLYDMWRETGAIETATLDRIKPEDLVDHSPIEQLLSS